MNGQRRYELTDLTNAKTVDFIGVFLYAMLRM